MAGDSLRASAPTAAPTEGTTSFPSSFAFRRSPHFSGELFRSHATITSGDYFSIAAEISGEDQPVLFARNVGTLRSVIRLTPEQARAVAAELIAAADALQVREDAPKAGEPEMGAPAPERRKLAEGLLYDLLERETTVMPGNEALSRMLDTACGIDEDGAACDAPEDLRPVLRQLLELAGQPVPPVASGRNRESKTQAAQHQRERLKLFACSALLLIDPAASASNTRGA